MLLSVPLNKNEDTNDKYLLIIYTSWLHTVCYKLINRPFYMKKDIFYVLLLRRTIVMVK